jgi:hypothetical protein
MIGIGRPPFLPAADRGREFHRKPPALSLAFPQLDQARSMRHFHARPANPPDRC